MSRYDGLIIPRSYNEYINRTDPAALMQALQQNGVLADIVQAGNEKAVKSKAIIDYLQGNAQKTINGGLAVDSLTVNDSGFANSVFAKLTQTAIDIPSGTDFNTLTASGVYVSHDKVQDQYTNGAPNANYYMLVFNNSNRVITQIALCGNDSILYYRARPTDQKKWTDWKVIEGEQKNTAVMVQTGWEMTEFKNSIMNIHNIVSIQLDLYRENGIPNSQYFFGSIPAGYRPTIPVYISGTLIKADWSDKKPCSILIGTDGAVSVGYAEGTSNYVRLQVYGSYII